MSTAREMALAYEAGFVRRYACHPRLSDLGQTVGQHSHGVLLILLMLHPAPSRALLIEAAAHDLAERVAGDLPRPFKQKFTGLAVSHAQLEAKLRVDLLPAVLSPTGLTANDFIWLNAADAPERHLFAAVKAPLIATSSQWTQERDVIVEKFRDLGGGDTATAVAAFVENLLEQREGVSDGI